MLNWISLWWSTRLATGPARNAPNEGKDIKQLFVNKPPQVVVVSQTEVESIRKGLRPTKINTAPAKHTTRPIIEDLHNAFNQGISGFLQKKRANRPIILETIIIEANEFQDI